MTSLSRAELVELCEAKGIDPDIVIAVDVSAHDVVLVLRVPIVTELEHEADAQAARNLRHAPPYVPEI